MLNQLILGQHSDSLDNGFAVLVFIFVIGFFLFLTCLSIGWMRNMPGAGKVLALVFGIVPCLLAIYYYIKLVIEFQNLPDPILLGSVFFPFIIVGFVLAIVWGFGIMIMGIFR